MSDIELVIKIPEKVYNHILSMQFCIPGLRNGKSLLEEILKAIRTGIQLKRGHGDLIDRDNLLVDSYYTCDLSGNEINIVDVMTVKMADAIIEADKEQE